MINFRAKLGMVVVAAAAVLVGGECGHRLPVMPVAAQRTTAETQVLQSTAIAGAMAAIEIPACCTVERGVSTTTIAIVSSTKIHHNIINKSSHRSSSTTRTTTSRSRHPLLATSSNGTPFHHSSQVLQEMAKEVGAGETAVTIEIERGTGMDPGMEGGCLVSDLWPRLEDSTKLTIPFPTAS